MVKTHKRNKRTRLRGSRTAGSGFRKKNKGGVGNRGGWGWSGTMGQKQQKAQTFAKEMGFDKYFGKKGYTSASKAVDKSKQLNLDDIKANFFDKEGAKIMLKGYKVLGDGEGFKAEITAEAATQSAIDKMTKAGGTIILTDMRVKKVKPAKVAKVEVKKIVAPKVSEKKVEVKEKKVVKEKTPKK
jgi:ribosomal protein L15